MGVSDIIVCGHSHCDVVTEVMHDSLRHRGVRRRSGPADRRRHRRRALARAQAIRRALSPASGASTSPSASAATHAARRDGSGRMAASFSRGVQFDHVMPKVVRAGGVAWRVAEAGGDVAAVGEPVCADGQVPQGGHAPGRRAGAYAETSSA
ncbi:hypothetical protein [Streptomyces canus]|uniref:hypothetical protein n=1 Tax=Streptomyces canus TaxID=58343 RepID=UPI003F4B6915